MKKIKLSENTKKILFFIALFCIIVASIHDPLDGRITLSLPMFLLTIFACLTIRL